MNAVAVLAFLNLGLTETVVVCIVALLLFGPKAARMMGQLGRTLLDFKSGVDDAKRQVTRGIQREVDSLLHGPESEKKKPPAPPRE